MTTSRRTFLSASSQAAVGAVVAGGLLPSTLGAEPAGRTSRQAMGARVGEVTHDSAIVWTRLTAHATRNNDGNAFGRRRGPIDAASRQDAVTAPVEELEGACPGASGRIRIRYGSEPDLSDARVSDWAEVAAAGDFIHQFRIAGLNPATRYYYESQTTGPGGSPVHGALRGRFVTAPTAERPSELRFCVMTCQGYPDRGHPDGHPIYPAMLALDPAFTCLTGDLVYYDNDPPRAVSADLARYHWQRMFSLPRLVEFTTNVATYWLKDDHDTFGDDSWPGVKVGNFTWEQGLKIFREQAPLGDGPTYRTFRWGRDLQVWFTEGRDYRSPNKIPDGPEKSIWGAEQKDWFQRTVAESEATWKILVSPTPLVGPDRKHKNDNHANEGFQHEGDEIRAWLQKHVPDNFFVICGDRHWQYHSVHPQTGLHEFSAGAASDEHAGGSPGENKAIHRFHRVKGGFLSVSLTPTPGGSSIALRHHDIAGRVVHEHRQERPAG